MESYELRPGTKGMMPAGSWYESLVCQFGAPGIFVSGHGTNSASRGSASM
jgi:hypothetical protein